MQRMRKGFMTGAAAAAILLLLCPLFASGSDVAGISGRVRDSGGIPVMGAMVIIVPSAPNVPERIALTDKEGAFSIVNLFAGQYTVKVSMPHFLSAMKQGVQLNAGGTVVLTVNLQNALDVVRRAVARDKSQSEDIVWTLRSSRSTQPVLRLVDTSQTSEQARTVLGPDYTRLLPVVFEIGRDVLRYNGRHGLPVFGNDASGSENQGQRSTGSTTNHRCSRAELEHPTTLCRRSTIRQNLESTSVRAHLFADPLQTDPSREVQVRYGEDFQWSDHLVFNYGAEAGRAGTVSVTNYLRPRFGLSWVPQSRTTLTATMSSQAPVAPDDPVRGRDYFDRTLLVPPGLERYSHAELGLTRVFRRESGTLRRGFP